MKEVGIAGEPNGALGIARIAASLILFLLLPGLCDAHDSASPAREWPAMVKDPLSLSASDETKGTVRDFSLPDQENKTHDLYRQTKAKAVVLIFTSTGCPIVQKSMPKIKALRDAFSPKGVVFWLVDSNTSDDASSIRQEARDFSIDLPILMDHSQSLARALGVTRTAEAFCIEPGSWTVCYHGAIDDQLGYGTERVRARHAYLENALKNLLAGKRISPARTEAKGCLIQFEKTKDEL